MVKPQVSLINNRDHDVNNSLKYFMINKMYNFRCFKEELMALYVQYTIDLQVNERFWLIDMWKSVKVNIKY